MLRKLAKIEFNNSCATYRAVDIFKRYKDAFGNVTLAEMKSDSKGNYEFILTNDQKEQLIFNGECTSGYLGEGPNGTLKILKMAGFNIQDNFVYENNSFSIKK